MDIAKPYYASDKSIDFSKLKGPFVISSTLLYNSDLLGLRFNGKSSASVEIVDKLVAVPVSSSLGIVYKFVGRNIESTIAYDLSDLDALYYSSRNIASDGSPRATLKGRWILTDDVSNVKRTLYEDGDDSLSKIYFEYESFVDEKDDDGYDYAINVDIARRLLEKRADAKKIWQKKPEKNRGAKMNTNNNVNNNSLIDTISAKMNTNNNVNNNINNNNSCGKEAKNMNIGGIDLGQIVGMKMLSSLTKNHDVDLGKLMLVQSLAGGQPIQINDIMKAKLMSALVKDDTSIDNLPIDKLVMYKMFDSGNIDINQIIQLKMTKSLFEENDSLEPAAKK